MRRVQSRWFADLKANTIADGMSAVPPISVITTSADEVHRAGLGDRGCFLGCFLAICNGCLLDGTHGFMRGQANAGHDLSPIGSNFYETLPNQAAMAGRWWHGNAVSCSALSSQGFTYNRGGPRSAACGGNDHDGGLDQARRRSWP